MPVKLALVLVILIGSLLMLGFIITSFTPDEVGPVGVTSIFILVFVVGLAMLTLVKMFFNKTTTVTIEGSVGWALAPAVFLALGSLKQLTVVDVVLMLVFVALMGFYIRLATKNPRK